MDDYLNAGPLPELEEFSPLVPSELKGYKKFVNLDCPEAIEWSSLISDIQKFTSDGNLFIFIEGGHLFCDERVFDMCDKIMYIRCPTEIAQKRRLDRNKNRPPAILPAWEYYWKKYLVPFSFKMLEKASQVDTVVFF